MSEHELLVYMTNETMSLFILDDAAFVRIQTQMNDDQGPRFLNIAMPDGSTVGINVAHIISWQWKAPK